MVLSRIMKYHFSYDQWKIEREVKDIHDTVLFSR